MGLAAHQPITGSLRYRMGQRPACRWATASSPSTGLGSIFWQSPAAVLPFPAFTGRSPSAARSTAPPVASFAYRGVNFKPLSPASLNGSRHPSSADWFGLATPNPRGRRLARWRRGRPGRNHGKPTTSKSGQPAGASSNVVGDRAARRPIPAPQPGSRTSALNQPTLTCASISCLAGVGPRNSLDHHHEGRPWPDSKRPHLDLIVQSQADGNHRQRCPSTPASQPCSMAAAATTSGLTWGYYGGNVLVDSVVTQIASGTRPGRVDHKLHPEEAKP